MNQPILLENGMERRDFIKSLIAIATSSGIVGLLGNEEKSLKLIYKYRDGAFRQCRLAELYPGDIFLVKSKLKQVEIMLATGYPFSDADGEWKIESESQLFRQEDE